MRFLLFVLFSCAVFDWRFSQAKKVTLLDTRSEENILSGVTLDWQTWSTSGQSTDGWIEESYNDERDGVHYRTYVTCDVGSRGADNWLRTPYVEVEAAHRLYVEMSFTMRDCSLFPDKVHTCKETLSLYYYEADFDFAAQDMPAWNDETYTQIDRIAADKGRFSQSRSSGNSISVETRSILVTKKGVYFAIRDEGACASIISVKVYYEVCEEVTAGFSTFPQTATGRELTSIQKAKGKCVPNASLQSPNDHPEYLCKADGSWDILSGACRCDPGHYPLTAGQKCLPCQTGYYKDQAGSGPCLQCPTNSYSAGVGSSSCDCEDGYFRAANDPKSMMCTQPPSRPQNLKVDSVDQTSAVLSWLPPDSIGGRMDLEYIVECPDCSEETVFSPSRDGFNSTSITLMKLQPQTSYIVRVTARNGVADQVSTAQNAQVIVQTDRLVAYEVDTIEVEAVSSQSISISWSAPKAPSGRSLSGPVEYYTVKYWRKTRASVDQPQTVEPFETQTIEPTLTLTDLTPNSEYGIQVQAYIRGVGYGVWSDMLWVWTRTGFQVFPGSPTSPSSHTHVVTIIVVLSLFIVSLCVAAFCCYRCKQKRSGGPQSDVDILDYKTERFHSPSNNSNYSRATQSIAFIDGKPFISPLLHNPAACSTNSSSLSTHRYYVDPLTYEDPVEVVKRYATELPANSVAVEETIGAGEFGEVCRGVLRIPGLPDEVVAVKTLKPGASEQERISFLSEASIMAQLDHPNVVSLRGVVTQSEPVMIVTEYLENRSLDSFLSANEQKIGFSDLLRMLHQIAAGMKYLSDMRYVHRDLAARNVLVTSQLDCKIADFGLSRETEGSAYTTKGGKIPIRWTAPEAISHRRFTCAADVWSYGVLMWEVLTWGDRPFGDWSNQRVVDEITKGYRLRVPENCPMYLYELMCRCWAWDPLERPSFEQISRALESFLRQPHPQLNSNTMAQQYHHYGHNNFRTLPTSHHCPPHGATTILCHASTANLCPTTTTLYDAAPYDELNHSSEQFLASLGLGVHALHFYRAGLSSVRQLLRLNGDDLTALGVQQHNHAIILQRLERLRQSTYQTVQQRPDGFFV